MSISSRRVVATAFGGPESLAVEEVSLAEPGSRQVHVEVRASGVNPADVKSYARAGKPSDLPLPLGYEAAGVVRAVGEGAADDAGPLSVGDEVIVFRTRGAYAADLVVPDSALTRKPAGLGWPEAGGLLLAGATAFHTLEATAVAEGDTVLVHGGAGGVGLAAVQLARLRGARVIATAGERNHDLLRELGAEPVTYGDGLLDRVRALAHDGVDAALDLVGSDEAMDVSLALVDRDRIASIANFTRGPEEGIRLLGGGPGADAGDQLRAAARPELARLAGEGRLRVLVAATYPLDDAAQAHRQIATGHTTGKIVLVP
ncbi:NADP-dependent oxidoreductase [Nocardioides cynanchi]|uniref:NADP-dependent oxidoreductase n=1 Tax=Nocardioides cynanchi TaxID=2558918 RepID=UPI001782B0B9|nr:NADP-dependent oxidoreductase [Nocardioides cynanchi]